jgi:hypothetical protein
MLIVRRIIVSILSLPSLLMLCLGTLTFVRAMRVYDANMYSVQDSYIGDAVHLSVAGVFGLFACQRLWRTGSRWAWTIIPIGVAFYVVLYPNWKAWHHGTPLERAYRSTTLQLHSIAVQSAENAKTTGRLTCELIPDPQMGSLFSQGGQSLPYVVQCVPDVAAPMSNVPPARPATIVVSISKDATTAWLSATVLSHQIARQAVWLKRDGQPLVVTQQMKLNP